MELKEHQIKVLDLLKGHELAVSELYSVFADKFPEYGQFWSDLSEEEKKHATWITNLTEMTETGEVFFDQKRFNIEAIKTSLAGLKDDVAKAGREAISLISALSMAYYYETALIERKFFEVFEGDSAKLKHTLLYLSEETRKHQKMVKEALEKERAKSSASS